MDIYNQMAIIIIKQQEAMIGPIAVQRAMEVSNMAVDWTKQQVMIMKDGPAAIDELVRQYEHLLGGVSIETCKNAVAPFLVQLPPDKQPSLLRND